MRTSLINLISVSIAIMGLLGIAPRTLAAPPTYHVTDLGTLGGTVSRATGINNSGSVVGLSTLTGNDYRHAFLYDTSIHDIGTLGSHYSEAYAINNSGTVVGWSSHADNTAIHAFRYASGMQDLGVTREDGTGFSWAYAINDNGKIAGRASNVYSNFEHAFLNDTTPLHDLGTFIYDGAYSRACGINNGGTVVGWSDVADRSSRHAITYDTAMHDLGTLGGAKYDNSAAYAINGSGMITGESTNSAVTGSTQILHAFRYDTIMHDLGTLWTSNDYSIGLGINASGVVVGYSFKANDIGTAFYYDTQMYNLNSCLDASGKGWKLNEAAGINDKGQICGTGVNPQGETHAFLLTPVVPIAIVNIWMKTNTRMEIETVRNFGSQQRAVQLTVNFNGKDYALKPKMLGSNSTVPDPTPLEFDLRSSSVPRFTENAILTVRLSATLDSGVKAETSAQFFLLLPVILIPGIDPGGGLTSMGGRGTFSELENYLQTQSDIQIHNHTPSLFGQGYRVAPGYSPIPGYYTVFTLRYNRNQDSFVQGAAALSNLITSVMSGTYAAKVNIATHSKGGLVARQYVVGSKGMTVNRLIMCQPPNLGSAWAVLDGFAGENYSIMYPLWNWLSIGWPYYDFHPSNNLDLMRLNAQPLPKLPAAQAYTIIWSNTWKTPITSSGIGRSTEIGYGNGDLIVPDFSQLGKMFDPNHPNEPTPYIPAFRNVEIYTRMIPGNHVANKGADWKLHPYLGLPDVEAAIFNIIAQFPQ